jgi:hypothetical protein
VSWFSAGVSSAVATKLAIDRIDRVFYIHVDDQHSDTLRFVKDCEAWFGKPIEIMQSAYRCVANASRGVGYVNGPRGASCTRLLKKRVRKEWELGQGKTRLRYVWGMDFDEAKRCDRLRDAMPQQEHWFPLVERGITKEAAHQIMHASGIKRPAMYDLGYPNNNCVGCVKGGMGYWNKIRVDFPEVFAARAAMERDIGGTCINGVYLDDLDPERGRELEPIVEDCGIYCEMMRSMYDYDRTATIDAVPNEPADLAVREDRADCPHARGGECRLS